LIISGKKYENTDEKITFIGAVSPPVTGPGVKHSIFIEAMEKNSVEVKIINLLGSKITFLKNLSRLPKKKNNIILGASSKLRLLLIPYLYFISKLNGSRIILLPVGGKMVDEFSDFPSFLLNLYIIFLKQFDHIYIESKQLRDSLQNMLCENSMVDYLPNFKFRPKEKPEHNSKKNFSLVYLGRIKKTKGVNDIIDAFDILKDEDLDVELHFYGTFLKEDYFKKKFIRKVEERENITHHGYLSDERLIETLSDHDVFVFPTYHEGECFPGVLLDAFFSGLPVIASDWRFNGEIVQQGKNGLLCKPRNPDDLADKIKTLYEDEELLKEISKNAYEMSERYDAEKVVGKLINDLEKFGWLKY